jgi:hypothetical protein
MRKICLGILTCSTVVLCADSFRDSDAMIAGKDFPFPPDESDMPENTPSDDNNNGTTPAPQNPSSGTAPSNNSSRPKSGKDVFPPEPDVNTSKPQAGKDIFPPEDSD